MVDVQRFEWAAIPQRELHIPACLASGQAFRWRCDERGEWRGVIGRTAVVLRPEAHGFHWQTYPVPGQWAVLAQYFALDVRLEPLYGEWIGAVPEIAASCERLAGLRILRQAATETLFSFLCASCNTIVKIRRTLSALAARYGEPIFDVNGERFHAFPDVDRLALADEAELRSDLWGFRAPRVVRAAQFLQDQPDGWLEMLRDAPREEATRALQSLFGIGAKIADCIALFGLWHDDAVPIDTHVRQIAVRLFRPDLYAKSLTPTVYEALANTYRERFGTYAGWAQQYLFFEELKPGTTMGASA
jgi:N-glycosylase/DNA lyase